jgi:uncharacterized protein YueI
MEEKPKSVSEFIKEAEELMHEHEKVRKITIETEITTIVIEKPIDEPKKELVLPMLNENKLELGDHAKETIEKLFTKFGNFQKLLT